MTEIFQRINLVGNVLFGRGCFVGFFFLVSEIYLCRKTGVNMWKTWWGNNTTSINTERRFSEEVKRIRPLCLIYQLIKWATPIIILICMIYSFSGCASPRLQDPHGHVVDVHAAPWRVEDAPEARLVWVDAPPVDRITRVVTNQSGTARAYILTQPWTGSSSREHVQIEDLKKKRVYELEGIPFEWRDYDGLAWSRDRYLLFDRWTNPHYGRHFVVDFKARKLVLMAPFPDEFSRDSDSTAHKNQSTQSPTHFERWYAEAETEMSFPGEELFESGSSIAEIKGRWILEHLDEYGELEIWR